jgi:hypothetical protein
MEMSGQFDTSIALTLPPKNCQYPLRKRLRGPRNWYGRCADRPLLSLSGIELRFIGRLSYIVAAISTEV